MKTFHALSIVDPAGVRTARGEKVLEIRRWAPDVLPLRDLLIVQNGQRLSRRGITEDAHGAAVALVDVEAVRAWKPEDVAASGAARWEPGWLAWELLHVRPVVYPAPLVARRRIYELVLDETRLVFAGTAPCPDQLAARAVAVTIRPVELADADAVQLYASDAALAATCNVPHPYPPDGGAKFVERCLRAGAARERFPSVIMAEGNQWAGVIGINSPDFVRGTFEVDYWVARPFWGRGVATAAVGSAVRFAFDELRLHTAFSGCLSRNPASVRVLEKNGFREIEPIVNDGRYGTKFLGEMIRRFTLTRKRGRIDESEKRAQGFSRFSRRVFADSSA